MRITSRVDGDERVVVVEGAVGPPEAAVLQAALTREVAADGGRDVVLDVREVPAFDDAALVALTAGRSRAKFLRRRIVVVDRPDGPTTRSLRSSGQVFRFPVHPDVDRAQSALADDRTALAAVNPLAWREVTEIVRPGRR